MINFNQLGGVVVSVSVLLAICCFVTFCQATDDHYLIEGKKVESFVEAITILRRFMPKTFNQEERCKRYAVVLKRIDDSATTYNENKKTTNYILTNFALTAPNNIQNAYREISIEPLRNLYIEAIKEYRSLNLADEGLLDVADCLMTKFGRHDAEAQALISTKWFQNTLKQYRTISKAPVGRLLAARDGVQADKFDLEWSELTPTIQGTVKSWFGGDEIKARRMFINNVNEEPSAQDTTTPSVSSASGPQAKQFQPESVNLPDPVSQQDNFEEEDQVEQQQPQQSQLQPQPQPQQSQQAHEESQVPVEEEPGVDEDLENILKGIVNVYHKLSDESQNLGTRCRVYNKEILSTVEQLNDEDYQKRLAAEALEAEKNGGEKSFTPNEKERESFIMVAYSADSLATTDPEVWVDLVDCVDAWSGIDKNAEAFVKDENVGKLMQKVIELAQSEGAMEQVGENTSANPEKPATPRA